jgi:putative SOS response-associated peptidase YedK
MCGRYTLTVPGEQVAEMFDLAETPQLEPRYNIAPTQQVPAIRVERPGGERRLSFFHWGLIPHWSKDPSIGNRMINARSETAAEKPSFRTPFKRRRCLVVADGFYEWKKRGSGPKQPYYVHLAGGDPFAFAGLWEHWRGDGEEIESCTLLTTRPNELMKPLHDRMPVILPSAAYDLWLDPSVDDREQLEELLQPYDPEPMEAYPVSTYVNRPGNQGARCIEPLSGG